MFKKTAGTLLAAAAVAAAAVAVPATALAAPATVMISTGDSVAIRHTDGRTDSGCTLGFILTGGDNQPRGLMAGHCGNLHDEIATLDGRTIGRIAAVEYPGTDNGPDTALVSFAPGVSVDARIAGQRPIVGELTKSDVKRSNPILCKLGATTGRTCGPFADVAAPDSMIAFHGLNEHGDSGSPVWAYGTNGEVLAFGTLSGGPNGNSNITYVEPISRYMTLWNLH